MLPFTLGTQELEETPKPSAFNKATRISLEKLEVIYLDSSAPQKKSPVSLALVKDTLL